MVIINKNELVKNSLIKIIKRDRLHHKYKYKIQIQIQIILEVLHTCRFLHVCRIHPFFSLLPFLLPTIEATMRISPNDLLTFLSPPSCSAWMRFCIFIQTVVTRINLVTWEFLAPFWFWSRTGYRWIRPRPL